MAKARPWTLRMQQLFTPAEQARIAPYLNDVRARIDLRQRLGEQAAAYAQDYSWEKIAADILDLYNEVLHHQLIPA